MRLFHGRRVRNPHLPQLADGIDEQEGGAVIQANKQQKKRKRNEDKKKLDTVPLELKEGMEVLLQGIKTKLWNIEGVVKQVRPGGHSAFIYIPSKDKTYLMNRRFMKLNIALEYEDDKSESNSCFALSVQRWRKQEENSMNPIFNQSKIHMRKKGDKTVSFSELALVGDTPLISKTADSNVKTFNLAIRNL